MYLDRVSRKTSGWLSLSVGRVGVIVVFGSGGGGFGLGTGTFDFHMLWLSRFRLARMQTRHGSR